MRKIFCILLMSFVVLFGETRNEEIKNELTQIMSKGSEVNQSQSQMLDIVANKIAQQEENGEIEEVEEDKSSLNFVVNEIIKTNLKISNLQSQNNDANQSGQEIENLKNNKNKLLESLPLAITKQKINKNSIEKYVQNVKNIKNTIKNSNQKSLKFAKASVDLEKIKLDGIFYKSLLKIEDMFVNGVSSHELQNELESALSEIQNYDVSNLSTLKDKLNDADKNEFETIFFEILNNKKSYEEIINYLLNHHDLLASSVLLTSLNLKSVIDTINNIMPFQSKKINAGKIIIIVLLMGFFYSFKKFFANLIYLFLKLFSKNKNLENNELKSSFIDIIQRPIGTLLLIYAADICTAIAFYPAPMPIKIASAFSIAYILLYAWLVINILDGYGIIFFGNLAKKSARKEVINLIIKILYIIVIIIASLFILKRLGFNISALLASLGIGGLAIALATKDIIANFFTSVMLLFDNSFSQGDFVNINGIEGEVVEIGLKKTTIRTLENALVFIPNSTVATQNIENWSRRKIGRQIKFKVGVEYSSTSVQLKNAIAQIKKMLENHPDIAGKDDTAINSKDHKTKNRQHIVSIDNLVGYKNTISVVLDEFADSSINILIFCYTKTTAYTNFLEVKEDILFKIMEIIENNKLSFAFPSQSLYIQNNQNTFSC